MPIKIDTTPTLLANAKTNVISAARAIDAVTNSNGRIPVAAVNAMFTALGHANATMYRIKTLQDTDPAKFDAVMLQMGTIVSGATANDAMELFAQFSVLVPSVHAQINAAAAANAEPIVIHLDAETKMRSVKAVGSYNDAASNRIRGISELKTMAEAIVID